MNSGPPSPVRSPAIVEPENHEEKEDEDETSSEPGDIHTDGQARVDDVSKTQTPILMQTL